MTTKLQLAELLADYSMAHPISIPPGADRDYYIKRNMKYTKAQLVRQIERITAPEAGA